MLTKQELLATVKEYCSQREEIAAVYAFGSVVEERFSQNSDLDLGIMVALGVNKVAAFDLKLELAAKLEELVDREVDIVIFSQAPLRLKQQIINGKLILERDKQLRVRKESKTRNKYCDMQYFYRMYEEKIGKGLKDG